MTRASNANLNPKTPPIPHRPGKAQKKATAKGAAPQAKAATPKKAKAIVPVTLPPVGMGTGANTQAKTSTAREVADQIAKAAGLPGEQSAKAPFFVSTVDGVQMGAQPAAGLVIPSEAQAAPTPGAPASRRLNAQERSYAKARVESIISRKHAEFKAEREDPSRWNRRDILFRQAVALGRYEIDLKRLPKCDADTRLDQIVKLFDYPQGLDVHIAAQDAELKARQSHMASLGARLIDEIMLGSAADAIRRIQAFEDTKF